MKYKNVRAMLMAPDTGTSGAAGGDTQQTQQSPTGNQQQTGQMQSPVIDYAKIQQMLEGTLAAKEDTALKAYFKQQGLSQQEAEQAMASFKQQKAANQPDVNALQMRATQAQAETQKMQIENAAILQAIELGLDAKTIPYVLKMADLSRVAGEDGKINEETLKNALETVLNDVPALKPQTQQATGFKMGAPSGGQQTTATDDALKRAFGL